MRLMTSTRWLSRTALAVLFLLGVGCTTSMQDRHHALYLQRQDGQLSEEEYRERLQALRDEQPWGGVDSENRWNNEPIIVYPTR